jgi:GxxExxY protein
MLPTDLLTTHFRIDDVHKKALKRLGISTVEDLLLHLPQRYEDITDVQSVGGLVKGQDAVVFGQIGGLGTRKSWKSRVPISEGWVEDGTARIKIMWFHQPYIAKMLTDGMYAKVTGKVTGTEGKLYIVNPEVERLDSLPIDRHDSIFKGTEDQDDTIYPVYRETKGVTSKWFFHTVTKCFERGVLEKLDDTIPKAVLRRYNLPTLKTALVWIHAPKKQDHAESARKRFAFEEVFYIQTAKARERAEVSAAASYVVRTENAHIDAFTSRFPFPLTNAQKKAINDILKDFTGKHPMSRLLEGDVGSGKTAVAATTAYAVATSRPTNTSINALLKKGGRSNFEDSSRRGESGEGGVEDYDDRNTEAPQQRNVPKFEMPTEFGNLQVAYMAPTEILAKQHFESFITFFAHLPIQIGLITGSGCMKFPSKTNPTKPTPISKAQLLKWVKNGEIPILIGTHALMYKSVEFKHLAHVIIDEQHRFGVNQRKALARGKDADRTRRNADTCGQDAEKTQIDTTKDSSDPLLYRDLTYRIREALYAVTKELGMGHKESIYQHALEEEFHTRNLTFDTQVQIPILYNRKKVGTYIPDFVVEGKIVIELKSLPFLGDQPKKQLWQYLKGSPYKLGLLVNLGGSKLTIERVIYDTARNNSSALHPRPVRDLPRTSMPVPHLLSMSATPIPRTLALTVYGDLDLSLLDEMPKGRKPIITKVVAPSHIEEVYEHVRSELASGRQAYVICPRIDEPDPTMENALQLKSVKQEAERLKEYVFKKARIDILHSKMTPKEKDTVMEKFLNHDIDILVATSVVEVGVNVPNATNIIIEGAERFGLAQLHQLRGRVVRGTHQAYCFAVTTKDSTGKSGKTIERLKALTEARNGFELAEYDLQLRGSGELYGMKQWGLTDLGMEALKNIKMVEAARKEAQTLIEEDPDLENHPDIARRIAILNVELHME